MKVKILLRITAEAMELPDISIEAVYDITNNLMLSEDMKADGETLESMQTTEYDGYWSFKEADAVLLDGEYYYHVLKCD